MGRGRGWGVSVGWEGALLGCWVPRSERYASHWLAWLRKPSTHVLQQALERGPGQQHVHGRLHRPLQLRLRLQACCAQVRP